MDASWHQVGGGVAAVRETETEHGEDQDEQLCAPVIDRLRSAVRSAAELGEQCVHVRTRVAQQGGFTCAVGTNRARSMSMRHSETSSGTEQDMEKEWILLLPRARSRDRSQFLRLWSELGLDATKSRWAPLKPPGARGVLVTLA